MEDATTVAGRIFRRRTNGERLQMNFPRALQTRDERDAMRALDSYGTESRIAVYFGCEQVGRKIPHLPLISAAPHETPPALQEEAVEKGD
jgi:hypothetical protein